MAFTTILHASRTARGRVQLVFSHLDDVAGAVFGPFVEFRPEGEDQAGFFLACREALFASMVEADIADNLGRIRADGSLATVALRYATLADVRSALRNAYLGASRIEAIMIGDFLNTLTNVQLQALFGMTAGQVTTLRSSKLTPAASAAATIRAASGA